MTKRNVLLALGLIVAIAGVAIGSGAFSQVEADRNVSITVDDDNAAFVQIEDAGSSFVSTNGGEVEISTSDLNNGVHQNATVTTDPALNFTHNGNSSMNYTITLDSSNVDNGNVTMYKSSDDSEITSANTLEVASQDAPSDNTVYFEISTGNGNDISGNFTITIEETQDTS